jgi:hypothetical protein
MASVIALPNELRSIVLRGVQRLRWIEMASEAAEELLLDARMIVAASLHDSYDPEWAPSPEEIAAARDEIYAGWSGEEQASGDRLASTCGDQRAASPELRGEPRDDSGATSRTA